MSKKRELSMIHYIVYGAIMGAMFSVVIGQNMIEGAEASSDITMNLVIAGLLIGSISGGVLGKKKRQKVEPDQAEESS